MLPMKSSVNRRTLLVPLFWSLGISKFLVCGEFQRTNVSGIFQSAIVSEASGSATIPNAQQPFTNPETSADGSASILDTHQPFTNPETSADGSASIPDTHQPFTNPETSADGSASIPDTHQPFTIPEASGSALIPDTFQPFTIPETSGPSMIPDTLQTFTIPETSGSITFPDPHQPFTSSNKLQPTKMMPDNMSPEKIVDYINSINTTWKARNNFKGIPLDNRQIEKNFFKPKLLDENTPKNLILPDSFDARENWPTCTTMNLIRDQGSCESIRAVSATSVISDRICVILGRKVVEISAQEAVSCTGTEKTICRGGFSAEVYKYWIDNGLVTGGGYNSSIGCQPYLIPPCDHTTENYSCSNTFDAQTCIKKCEDYYHLTYEEDKHYGEKFYSVRRDQDIIRNEIMQRGPVEAMFLMYEDFPFYSSGVYKRSSDNIIAVHSARLLGWGLENGAIPYWLAANCWNTDWGENDIIKYLQQLNISYHCILGLLCVKRIMLKDNSTSNHSSRKLKVGERNLTVRCSRIIETNREPK